MRSRILQPQTSAEFAVDRWIHISAIALAAFGAVLLAVRVAVGRGGGVSGLSVLVYAICLVTMLGCSTAYHLATGGETHRALFRRLDHAAIFLMIAGTYTPFADRAEPAMTMLIWAVALGGAGLKLLAPARFEQDVVIYLAFGWMVFAALHPVVTMLDPVAIVLLVAGGILYSIGAGVHLCARLPFHNAIWHIFVVCAAGCHYAAVMHMTR
jgi:hemolysin III